MVIMLKKTETNVYRHQNRLNTCEIIFTLSLACLIHFQNKPHYAQLTRRINKHGKVNKVRNILLFIIFTNVDVFILL